MIYMGGGWKPKGWHYYIAMWSLGFYGYGQKEADREFQGMNQDTVYVNFAGISPHQVKSFFMISKMDIWQILFLVIKKLSKL